MHRVRASEAASQLPGGVHPYPAALLSLTQVEMLSGTL